MFEAYRAGANGRAEFGFDHAAAGAAGSNEVASREPQRGFGSVGEDSVKPQSASDPGPAFDEVTSTIGTNATVSGVIDNGNDVDYYNVTLTAGQTYLISLVGSGGSPIPDTYLTLTSGGTPVAEDDDGGQGAYSLLTYTPQVTGSYQIRVEGYPDYDDTGGYTLAVRQAGADVGSTTATATAIGLGQTFGFIDSSNDADMYAVTLTAGQYYSFTLDGGVDYATEAIQAGELDTLLTIYNSAGQQIAHNDDASSDLNSAIGFVAETSGTYYVRAAAFPGNTGGYALNIEQIDLNSLSPLDSLDSGLHLTSNTVTVYFATAGQTYDGVTSLGWTQYEMDQVMEALQTYSAISNLTFTVTTNPNNATFRLVTTESEEYLGYFHFPQTTGAGIGVFAINGDGWDRTGATGGLEPGGYGFVTLVHEFGHGLGLSHPHEAAGASTPMPGVTGPFDSYGVFDLNQGIYTTMSYNDGWRLHPDGTPSALDYGWQAGPGALDIAVIQQAYGASTLNTGSNVYVLPTANAAGTFWDVIWDTGGTDSIVHNGTVSATIDLHAATLDYSATGGGAISFVDGIFGGFTIANGVVIENASGGSGADLIIGNNSVNQLVGGGGNDTITGWLGADTLTGGAGADTFIDISSGLNGDTITDFALGDRIVFTNASLGSFTFSRSGSTLTYSTGTMTLTGVTGTLVASAAPEGGVQLTLSAGPPPPVTRAVLTLTEAGQDFTVGGNFRVFGTASGGEVIEVLHGDVAFDASFNLGGDTVVLAGNAGTYSASLSGSFVTITGGGATVAIPVGTAGLDVQFADSTRELRFEGGQVLLGTQVITSTSAGVSASGPPLTNPAETGPDSLGRLVLGEPGQDVDIGGNVRVFGTTSPGEVVTVLDGSMIFDASFNVGGDTIALPGASGAYSATRAGSFVTITDGDGISVAIPVGIPGLTVDFADGSAVLRYDTETGQVMLGDQVVMPAGSIATEPTWVGMAGLADEEGAGATFEGMFAAESPELAKLSYGDVAIDAHRVDVDSFSFG